MWESYNQQLLIRVQVMEFEAFCNAYYLHSLSRAMYGLPPVFPSREGCEAWSPFQNMPFPPPFPMMPALQSAESSSSQGRQLDNIVLSGGVQGRTQPKTAREAPLKRKIYKKPTQKDNRNVTSNLLRIFLRNMLEFHHYGQAVRSMLAHLKSNITQAGFYEWVLSFGINYKNYIKTSHLSRVMRQPRSATQQRVFAALLRRYLDLEGVSHCLTSKRIGANGVRMHLAGIRELRAELASLTRPPK